MQIVRLYSVTCVALGSMGHVKACPMVLNSCCLASLLAPILRNLLVRVLSNLLSKRLRLLHSRIVCLNSLVI